MTDGQAWTLPLPVIALVPVETDAGFEVRLDLHGADNYQALLKSYDDANEGDAIYKCEFALARALLMTNYDLTFAQFASICQFGFDDSNPDGKRIRMEVRAIATGNAPKLQDDGEELSDSQPE